MQYFENDASYGGVPRWAAAALGLGYQWRLREGGARRIGLLSMPFESEAAGLIALGALRSDLERTSANHLDTYFDLLVSVCRQRMAAGMCRVEHSEDYSWDVLNTADDTRWHMVSYEASNDAIVLQYAGHRSVIKRNGKSVPNPNGACSRLIMRNNAIGWQLRNCPLPQLPPDGKALEPYAYNTLPGCTGPILDENLRQSYDGLVLVGQGSARDSGYMHKFYTAGFASADNRFPIGDLLTLHHSQRKYIRRLRFLSDRAPPNEALQAAWLVVADGISALLYAEKLFPSSDIIGVCNRDTSDEGILQLKDWLNNIVRYYSDTDTSQCLSGEIPAGMLLRVLQRRT